MKTLTILFTASLTTPRVIELAKMSRIIAEAFAALALLVSATSKSSNEATRHHRSVTLSSHSGSSANVTSGVLSQSINNGRFEIQEEPVIRVTPAVHTLSSRHAVSVSGVRSVFSSGLFFESGDRAHSFNRRNALSVATPHPTYLCTNHSVNLIAASQYALSIGLIRKRDAYGGAAEMEVHHGKEKRRKK